MQANEEFVSQCLFVFRHPGVQGTGTVTAYLLEGMIFVRIVAPGRHNGVAKFIARIMDAFTKHIVVTRREGDHTWKGKVI